MIYIFLDTKHLEVRPYYSLNRLCRMEKIDKLDDSDLPFVGEDFKVTKNAIETRI